MPAHATPHATTHATPHATPRATPRATPALPSPLLWIAVLAVAALLPLSAGYAAAPRPGAPAVLPTLLYSTYYGSYERDTIQDVGRDAAGNIYVMGTTFQTDIDYGDILLAKFSPDGQQLVYVSIFGGTRIDYGYGLAVDAAGNATVAGIATSFDYPVQNALQPNHAGGIYDVVLTKVNPGGGVVFSTYLGGAGTDYGERLATDDQGNVYLTGHTTSTNFPTTPGVFQPGNHGSSDGYVAKIAPNGSALVWSTYLGGLYQDESYDIALDALGSVYLTGKTTSPDFPTLNPFQPNLASSDGDAFVTKLNADATALIFSTYLGGSNGFTPATDQGRGIAVGAGEFVYVTGYTEAPNFPTTPGSFQPQFRGYFDAFVTKFTPAGSALVYSTFVGGVVNPPFGDDEAFDIAVDGAGQAVITGKTNSPDFPLRDPVQPQMADPHDAFVTQLNAAGSDLVYSTYLGGNWLPPNQTGDDSGSAVLIDGAGNTVVAGGTGSADFPVVNAFQYENAGKSDGFISKLSGSNPVLTATPTATGATPTPPPPSATPSATACGYSQLLSEGFESGTLGDFTATATPTNAPGWRASTSGSHGGVYSAHAPSIWFASDQRLTSPVVSVPAGVDATLRFWHRYMLENYVEGCIDGAVLELSTNGGSSWLDAEPYIVGPGGYDGLISSGNGNPLDGRRGWCGQHPTFTEVTVNLAPFAGEDLLLRFREGTDNFIDWTGWWVDDISVTTACAASTPAPTVTPTAIPAATSTASATPPASTPTATGAPAGARVYLPLMVSNTP